MDVEHDLKFDPPVYRLRYAFVQDTLLEETSRINIRKVVEFGCAEMKLLPYMKRLFTLRTILLVDIDKELLNENLFRIRPMTFDYLFKRSDSLEVSVYAGSISDPDCSLVDTDVVIGIELIEHLYPDVLEALPHNIFGYMQPHLVILTTPNADFNVLFKNFKGMRHFDHKFEWTRQQFNDWATNITERYPNYNVTFAGVGNPPEQCEGYGFCSQIAIFRRMEVPNRNEVPFDYHRTNEKMLHDDFDISFGICTYCSYKAQMDMYESYGSIEERIPNDHSEASNIYYQLLDKMDYPYEKDDRTNAEKNLDEIKYNMHKLGHINGIYFNDDRDRSEIPLYQVIKDYHGNFVTESEARSILIKHGYAVQDCLVNGFEESCVIYEPIMNSSNISPLSGTTDDDTFALDEEEDWDTYYNTENYKNPSDKMVNTDADTDANNKEITARKSTLKSSQQQQQKTNKTVAIDEAASKLKLENDSRTYDDLNEVYPLAGTSASFSSANSSQHSRKKRKKRNDYEEEAMRPVEVIANDLIDGALDSLDKNETSCANSQSNTESNSPSFSSSVTTSVTQTDDSRSQNDSDRTVPERELAHASREVLYDSNSEVSMLEDFDMAMERWEDVASEQNVSQPQLVLLGINVNNNNEDDVLSKLL